MARDHTGPDGLDNDENYTENHIHTYDADNPTPDYLSEAMEEADWLLAPVKVRYQQREFQNYNPWHQGTWTLPVKETTETRINLPKLLEAINKKHRVLSISDLE